VNEISQGYCKDVTKGPYLEWLAMNIAKGRYLPGHIDCCAAYSGRSSLANGVPWDAPRQTYVSRTKSTLLGMTLLVAAAIPMAQGQDATPAATQSANQSTAGQPKRPDKNPPVCFKLTGRCVEAGGAGASPTTAPGTAPTKGGAATPTKSAPSQKAPLNLAAPDVRAVVPEEELQEPLPPGDQITEVQEDRTVAVKAEGVPPDVPLGFGAIWWALNHPSQAWRILTPAE
jgi:hypothetical protein